MKPRGLARVLSDFRNHPWLHALSIFTITLSLSILGIFLLFYQNFKSVAENTSPKILGTIYLKDAQPNQVSSLKETVLQMPHVSDVQFKTRDSVVRELEEFFGAQQADGNLPGGELFPDVLEVTLARGTNESEILALQAMLRQALATVPSLAPVCAAGLLTCVTNVSRADRPGGADPCIAGAGRQFHHPGGRPPSRACAGRRLDEGT